MVPTIPVLKNKPFLSKLRDVRGSYGVVVSSVAICALLLRHFNLVDSHILLHSYKGGAQSDARLSGRTYRLLQDQCNTLSQDQGAVEHLR